MLIPHLDGTVAGWMARLGHDAVKRHAQVDFFSLSFTRASPPGNIFGWYAVSVPGADSPYRPSDLAGPYFAPADPVYGCLCGHVFRLLLAGASIGRADPLPLRNRLNFQI